jgi:sigma-B regulation protein RsbU (phosphoserine phosphatase)
MRTSRLPWEQELAIIDEAMRAISGVMDPEELVSVYWQHIGKIVNIENYIAVSRRGVEPPDFLVTRSSRFTEDINPWTQRDRLPRLRGGVLGEVAYANKPLILHDLPSRLTVDDPARFYLDGFQTMIALPQYDDGEGLNVTAMLLETGDTVDPAIIPMLHWQSGLFGRGTQNLVLRNQLATAWSRLDDELKTVGAIQRSLLPADVPPIPGFDIAAHYQTSARAGGDYYDFFALPDGRWGIFIADVSGHGTPAAVLMAITHALAHAHPGSQTPPGVMLAHLNDRLCRSYTRGGTFVTAFYAVLDPERRTLTYARAGHNPPRLVRRGRAEPLDAAGALPMGILSDQAFDESTVQLNAGDLLVLYTDGVTEAAAPTRPDETRTLFGTERLDALLLQCGASRPSACVESIRQSVADFTGNAPLADDMTILAIRPVG